MILRKYTPHDETEWLRCRMAAFLDCSYYDDIVRERPVYQNPSLCIVAVENGKIIGFLDAEYERSPGEVCYLKGGRGAVLWNLGVLPEYRNQAVAAKMWQYVRETLVQNGITRFEVWTQDDKPANTWYQKQGFLQKEAYLNAYIKGTPKDDTIRRFLNLDTAGDIYGVRCLNFEAPIERKAELQKICFRLHEVRVYELELQQ